MFGPEWRRDDTIRSAASGLRPSQEAGPVMAGPPDVGTEGAQALGHRALRAVTMALTVGSPTTASRRNDPWAGARSAPGVSPAAWDLRPRTLRRRLLRARPGAPTRQA